MTEGQKSFVRGIGGFCMGWAGIGFFIKSAHLSSDPYVFVIGVALLLYGIYA